MTRWLKWPLPLAWLALIIMAFGIWQKSPFTLLAAMIDALLVAIYCLVAELRAKRVSPVEWQLIKSIREVERGHCKRIAVPGKWRVWRDSRTLHIEVI